MAKKHNRYTKPTKEEVAQNIANANRERNSLTKEDVRIHMQKDGAGGRYYSITKNGEGQGVAFDYLDNAIDYAKKNLI